ncbi:MAG: phosphoenolpyruvate--protein phosphotransferase [Endomicrobium sp.]|jgi:phosphotransferase system enzyme I (PtsI)|nr:phosphoenolpyruvate--protein phosphotransferase [Endomicrobium sp.]
MSKLENIILKGITASGGVSVGKAFLLDDDDICLIYREIPKNARENEKKRFDDAIEKTRQEFKEIYNKINDILGENYAHIADTHILILDDMNMRKDVYKLIEEGSNAEYAIFKVMDKVIRSFESIKDDYFKERKVDIQEVAKKILTNLLGKRKRSFRDLKENSIVVAHNLTPADTVTIKEKLIKGFITDVGGKTSHTAIMAQGLGIPAVVGLKVVSSQIKTGDTIILNGNTGEVILNPSAELLEKYQKEYDRQNEVIKELKKLKDLPIETLDKRSVLIFANIDNPDEVSSVLNNEAKGIGLYRTEFMYFNRNSIPCEQEHFEAYYRVVKEMSGYPTTIRTVDLGGDKLAKFGLLKLGREQNPFLGLRAIRLCLKYPDDIFIPQLRGILRASAFGKVRLMYPMISGLDELRDANKILQDVKQDLRKTNISFDEDMEVGTMIEIPSAAVIMDMIAKEVDFVSIGTNDLIQYTLAVDRINENVANIYNPMHPAVLRLIKHIIDNAHKEKIEVGMCGEMAGDPYYTPILLGFGLDEFSVSPFQVLKIKKVICGVSFEQARAISAKILKCGDKESISKIVSAIQMI